MYRVLLEPDDNGTLLVIVAVGMLAAVRFHNEFRLDAGKIHNVGRDRMLPTETVPELIVTKLSPQGSFRIGHVPPQLLTAPCHRRSAAHRPHPVPPPLAGEGNNTRLPFRPARKPKRG